MFLRLTMVWNVVEDTPQVQRLEGIHEQQQVLAVNFKQTWPTRMTDW